MQAEASAQASPGLIFDALHGRKCLLKRPAPQEILVRAMILKFWKPASFSLCVCIVLISGLGHTLVAQTGNVVISTNTTYPTGTYNLTSLTVENGANLTIGGGSTVTVSGAVLVTENSNIVLQSISNAAQVNGTWQGAGVMLNAGSVEVEAQSMQTGRGMLRMPVRAERLVGRVLVDHMVA